MYRTPRRLNVGDRVAVVAPASPFMSDEIQDGLDIVAEAGLVPVLAPSVKMLRTSNIHASSAQSRADELMWAFSDPSIAGILIATGGFGSSEVLPYLDYDVIAQTRKPLMGFSDITALNNGILAHSGLISINGQTLSIRVSEGDFLRKADSESLAFALELLMSDKPWGSRPFQINDRMPRCISPGRARGHVIGGNMDTFTRLLGTEFLPAYEGSILFVEDVHKRVTGIARELLHLKMCGVLDMLGGIVVGEFVDAGTDKQGRLTTDEEATMDQMLQEYLGGLGIPCVYGYSFSHGPYTIPVPIGAIVDMDAESGEISFDFSMA